MGIFYKILGLELGLGKFSKTYLNGTNFPSRDKLKTCILNVFEYSEHHKKKSGVGLVNRRKLIKTITSIFIKLMEMKRIGG